MHIPRDTSTRHANQSISLNGLMNGSQNGSHGSSSWGGPFPSLHLWPIQDTFAMKMVHLPEGQRVKIGRQTNAKTTPGERNAYFDSKVLSRTHAEIWEHGNKIYIKDLKSSNGTFINNERLSPEGMESEPFEVKSEDILEFGIDIVSEDNRTIIHHKVAAKVYCVFGTEDAALSARELVHYQGNDNRSARRPGPGQAQNQGLSHIGQISQPVLSSGGKPNGLTFDHVLSKLQTELQRSKETGSELQSLTTAMTEVQDTLGGGLPPNQNGSATQFIPPQFQSASAEAAAALAGPHGQQAAAFIALQNQLGDTQTSLSAHLDKIHQLESQMREQQSLQNEMINLREQVDNSRRELESFMSSSASNAHDSADDDDTRSVVTLMDNEDAEERMRQRRAEENKSDSSLVTSDDLALRVQTLSTEIAEAAQASRTLQTQHSEAMAAVKLLTQRISVLESGIAARVAEEVGKAEQRWESWRLKFEDGWKRERENWETERERLRGVVREWEEASRRGREEVEDRELNDSLSGDDYDEEDDETEEGSSWKDDGVLSRPATTSNRIKHRRRRPSHRTTLAVRALKGIVAENGSSTPKAEAQSLSDLSPDSMNRLRARSARNVTARRRLDREGTKTSSQPAEADRDSSESGRDSGDTLKDSEKGVEHRKIKRQAGRPALHQPIPVFTVLIVAVVAGALYWRHRE